jgi:bacillolysin
MKAFRHGLAFTLLAAVFTAGAAHRVATVPAPEQIRAIQSLKTAGPVWKKAGPVIPDGKSSRALQKAERPDRAVLALASARGMKISDLLFAENGTIAFISGDLGSAGRLKTASSPALTMQSAVRTDRATRDLKLAQSWLETFASVMKIDNPAAEFVLDRYETDDMNSRHLRLQQCVGGVPVWANELYVHMDASDCVYAVNGRYAPSPAVDAGAGTVDAGRAVALGRAHLAGLNLLRGIPAGMKNLLRFAEPACEKTIWLDRRGEPHLAWRIDMAASVRDWFTLFIDASTGAVLHAFNNTKTEGAVDASGLDLNNAARAFRAYEDSGTYFMLSDANELSGSASRLPDNPAGGLQLIDLRNTDPSETSSFYMIASPSRTSWSDRSAVSGICNLGLIYNYLKNTHGRRAIDNAASTMLMVVNVTENNQAMDNAYWNGRAFFCGNGAEAFTPLAEALDVAAHEVMHGVTEYTANLIYQDESGALNESMSDFFACMVDRDDWLMGEDIMRPGMGSALRDLAQPGNSRVLSPLPSNMDQYDHTTEDYGGVHTNCGIPNRAAYLVANAIGRDKAEKIYYRALTNYMTRQTRFIDARKSLEQSAIDLYGGGAELDAVKAAFDEVKVAGGNGTGSVGTGSGGAGNEVTPVTGGSQWIAFVRDDKQVGLYDVTNKTDYFLSNVRVKSASDAWTQFSTTADGRYLYFINENGVLARADLSNLPNGYDYETFTSVYIQSQGDLWSAAVSRDGQYVALTSIYDNDENIYLLIDGQIYDVPLVLPTTQEGITRSTIRYPDVLDWSPNPDIPKLAFDAYNEITLSSGEKRAWWSMGEIDFTGEKYKLVALLPAQSDGSSAGNVQYSSIDPDCIAYTFIDVQGNWDVKIAHFAESGKDQFLQFPGRDVERPSFSPDDKHLAVDRLGDNRLLVLDLETRNFAALTLASGARNPEWFVIGGSTKAAESPAELPASFALEACYPNPFNASTTIAYTLGSAGRVSAAVYDVHGAFVRTLADGVQAAGRHTVAWDGTGARGLTLPSGVYFCRLNAENGFTAVRKMIMLK